VALPKSSEHIFKHAGTDISERQLHLFEGAKHEPFHETLAIRTAAIEYVVQYFEGQYRRSGEVVNPEGKQLVLAGGEVEMATLGSTSNTAEEANVGATEVSEVLEVSASTTSESTPVVAQKESAEPVSADSVQVEV